MKRFSRLLLPLFLFAALLLPSTARAQFEDAPPDIQAILFKMRQGRQPTEEEKQKIVQWSVNRHAGSPRNPRGQTRDEGGAPCVATWHVRVDTTSRNGDGWHAESHEEFQNQGACTVSVGAVSPGNFSVPFLLTGATATYLFKADPSPSRPPARGEMHATRKRTDSDGHVENCKGDFTWGGPTTPTVFSLSMGNVGGGDALFALGNMAPIAPMAGNQTCDVLNAPTDIQTGWSLMPLLKEWQQAKKYQGGDFSPSPAMHFSAKAIDAAMAKSGLITATETWDFQDPDNEETRVTGVGTLSLSINGGGLKIEPVDKKKFEQWLPAPLDDPRYAEDGKVGTLLAMKIQFEDATNSAPLTASLDDVSDNKGVCDNDPLDGEARKGLRFAAQDKQPAGVRVVDEQHADSNGAAVSEMTVLIEARDTAAYGTLNARSPLLGAEAKKQKIPLDDNNNDIADDWEKHNGIYDKNLPANWDEEDSPRGPDKGDGLTLYEEYRGIIISDDGTTEKFQRLPPGFKKEFFLVDRNDLGNALGFDLVPLVQQGLLIHQQAAADTLWIFRMATELKSKPTGHHTGQGFPIIQWRMNPNSNPAETKHFHNEHFAVQISSHSPTEDDRKVLRRASTMAASDPAAVPESADDAGGIFFFPENSQLGIQSEIQWFDGSHPAAETVYVDAWIKEKARAEPGFTRAAMLKRLRDPKVQAQLAATEIVFTIAHESGHTLGRHHHENGVANVPALSPQQTYEHPNLPPRSCPMYYPKKPAQLEFLWGSWDLTQGLDIDWPADLKSTGWLEHAQKQTYHFCNGDDGSTQGGVGAPRYKNR